MKKIITLILSVVLVVALCTPALAAGLTRQISATYGIKLEFNEQSATLTDAAGNTVAPFIYDGTTYVPIRAVANLFDAEIGYDAENYCAYIYDERAEACALVNRMRSVVSDCHDFANYEMFDAISGELPDNTDHFSACDREIKYIITVMNRLAKGNDQVVQASNQLIDKFVDYANVVADINEKYEDLRAHKTSYYANKFADAIDPEFDKYSAICTAIDNYYEQFCWRDLDSVLDE